MESPVKKLDFGVEDKENQPFDADVAALAASIDAAVEKPAVVEVLKKVEEPKPAVAATIKTHESDEPLLQENPGRFVLFPIKYHEVSPCRPAVAPPTRPRRVKWRPSSQPLHR